MGVYIDDADDVFEHRFSIVKSIQAFFIGDNIAHHGMKKGFAEPQS